MAFGWVQKNKASFKGGIGVGNVGTLVKSVYRGSGSFVIGTAATVATTEVAAADANVVGTASVIVASRPTGLNDDLIWLGCRPVAGSVIPGVYNPTGSGIAGGTVAYSYLVLNF